MQIQPFKLEEWLKKYEPSAKYNLAESCVYAVSLDDFFLITRLSKKDILDECCQIRLDYGNIDGGSLEIKEAVAGLYKTMKPENVMVVHGATEATPLICWTMLDAGDHIITLCPDYQQFISVPESMGVIVDHIHLSPDDSYSLPLDRIESTITDKTRAIIFSNPNNPTGSILTENELKGLIDLARKYNLYIICDEVYRQVLQDEAIVPSIADIYEKGISLGSMSKAFSLAGIRLGWIATPDNDMLQQIKYHSAYSMSSVGALTEYIAAKALEHKQTLIDRNMSLLRVNLITLDGWMSQNKEHLSYVHPQAGSTVLIYYDFDIPSEKLCAYVFEKTGTLITPGDMFHIPNSFRISYACDHRQLIAGLACLSEVLAEVSKNPEVVNTAKSEG